MELLTSLQDLIVAVLNLVVALAGSLLPWTPLAAWIAFWLLAVNWKKLYPVLAKGGIVGVVLLALMAILVWSSVSIPAGGSHSLFGLHVSNLVGKGVYVTGLTVIAFLCGSVQLSGACGRLCQFDEPAPAEESAHAAHH